MRRSPVNILLMSTIPQPIGGIGHWASMICEYSLHQEDVEITVLKTSSTWRSIHSIELLLRSLLFKDLKDFTNSTIIIQTGYS